MGGLSELGRAAIEAKDRLLVENIWVDARDAVATSYLRTLEGLCGYEDIPKSDPICPVLTTTCSEMRQHKHDERTAIVVAAPDRITGNFRSALEKTRGVIMAGNLLIHETRCPKLIYTLRQPLDELLKSPVMKALVWVITALEDHKGNDTFQVQETEPWYGNLPKNPS